jgi:hypothetical protein
MKEKNDDNESLSQMKEDNQEVIITQNNDEITRQKNVINFANSLSEKEIKSLLELKEYCASMGLEYRFDLYTTDILIRLLKSKKFNIIETYKVFVEFINFTRKYDVFNIKKVKFPNFDKIRLFYPHGFHKTTFDGNPVFIQMLGELKISDINRLLPEPLLTQYILYKIVEVEKEIFPKCSEKFKKNINKIYCVVDLLGLSTSLMNKQIMDFINKLISVCSNYYPGIMEELVFVNTSLVFRSIWAPCKYLYEYETRERIKLLGFDYKNELLKKIQFENLPKFFGGLCNCQPYGCIFSNVGPWNEQISEGEKRRSKNYLEKIKIKQEQTGNNEDDDDLDI